MAWGRGAPAEAGYDPDFIDRDTESTGLTFRIFGALAASMLAVLFAMILHPALDSRTQEGLSNLERDH